MAMSLLDSLPLDKRITTTAYASRVAGATVPGDLWLAGRGDPLVTGGSNFAGAFPFKTTRLGKLAKKIKSAGIERIEGRVMGSKGYFTRDWWARGWKSDFPSRYIARPTALTFDGNVHKGRHTQNPERYAARSLRKRLKAIGVKVDGDFGAGRPPATMVPVARIRSVNVKAPLQYMLRKSNNFFAEVFGKRLGLETGDEPSIPGGAAAMERWAALHGVDIDAFDASGLSYSNRVSPSGMIRLLSHAETATWGPTLRSMLPQGGQGTLEDRFGNVRLHAKTGTLSSISTLSGWVWLKRTRTWAEFAIMSSGMAKSTASDVEERVLRIIHRRGS